MLALNTVKKGFKSIGFKPSDEEHPTRMSHISLHTTIQAELGESIHLDNARWSKARNVHIVSYWRWPRNMKELNTMLEEIKTIYSELCNTRF